MEAPAGADAARRAVAAAAQAIFTISVKVVDTVCPAEITVIVGMKVPSGDDLLAVKLSVPDGLVSEAAYFSSTPPGKPPTITSAVSLVEVIWIGTFTCIPFCETTTTEIGRKTVIGV